MAIAYEGEGRDGYRDQIVTCDVGVSLHSKTHSLFMKYSNGTSTQCYAYHYPSLFPVLFLQSLYVPFFNSKNFSFTCLHSFFTSNCMCITPPPTNFLTYGENTIRRPMYIHSNEMCAPFCTSPNCSTDSSPQNVLTCNLALGQEVVATR